MRIIKNEKINRFSQMTDKNEGGNPLDVMRNQSKNPEFEKIRVLMGHIADAIEAFIKFNGDTYESAIKKIKSISKLLSPESNSEVIYNAAVSPNNPTRIIPEKARAVAGKSTLYDLIKRYEFFFENQDHTQNNSENKTLGIDSIDTDNATQFNLAVDNIGVFQEKSKASFDKNNETHFKKAYSIGVAKGKRDFRDIIINNSQLFSVHPQDEENAFSQVDSQMNNNEVVEAIKGVLDSQKYGRSINEILEISIGISFLLCVFNGDVKNMRENAKQNACNRYITRLNNLFGNKWSNVSDFDKLVGLAQKEKTDRSKDKLTQEQADRAWKNGVNEGAKKVEDLFVKNKNIEFDDDVDTASQYSRKYLLERTIEASRVFSSGDGFKTDNVSDFASSAMIVLTVIKAKVKSKTPETLKAEIEKQFDQMKSNWKNWEMYGFLKELNDLRTTSGYGKNFSPEESAKIWDSLLKKTFKEISSGLQKNPGMANIPGFQAILKTPYLLTDPRRLSEAFGKRLIYPEGIVISKDAIGKADSLKNANVETISTFIFNCIAAWSSGNNDWSSFANYDRLETAERYYSQQNSSNSTKVKNDQDTALSLRENNLENSSNWQKGGQSPKIDYSSLTVHNGKPVDMNTPLDRQTEENQNGNINNTNRNSPQKGNTPPKIPTVTYLGDRFIGTISVTLALLFDRANNRGRMLI